MPQEPHRMHGARFHGCVHVTRAASTGSEEKGWRREGQRQQTSYVRETGQQDFAERASPKYACTDGVQRKKEQEKNRMKKPFCTT